MNLALVISVSLILFFIGLLIVLLRKELLFILMGIELMFNGAALAAIAGAQYRNDPTGQVLALIFMIVAGAELVVSLLIVMHCLRKYGINRIDQLNRLHD
ncbi:MAG: NADH-quinone oxidoreductase subunit NuoK [Endozoicomonadaceae bacterium]|nr:NADH-quinone oxidoreductase subunit NuoK [Endozoicomonadaceae bacterium]